MKVLVLNGSPKGKNSISLQSALYLQKKFMADEFRIIHVGAMSKSLEKNFSPLEEAIEWADCLLFCYPVYTFLVPSQLHRCIELIKQHFPQGLNGKSAAQISTSKHFYDITAHRFIEENCQDLRLKYLKGISADMEDLLKPQGRNELIGFWKHIHYLNDWNMIDGPHKQAAMTTPPERCQPKANYDILIVTNSKDDPQLDQMIETFRKACLSPTRIINIAEYPIKGGCLGCFHCAADGNCIYTDGFPELLREKIQTASALIYAFTIRDHSMGSDFKMFDDRHFCNGHRMMTVGMPVGYLVNGDLSNENNLMMLMEARAEVGRNTLCGIVAKQGNQSTILYQSEERLADQIIYALNEKLVYPQNFYGVGGTKIFRDLIYQMRGIMQADHRFYKKAGLYRDFPQRHLGKMLMMKIIGFLMNNPKMRKKMGNKIDEGMMQPYKKILEKE